MAWDTNGPEVNQHDRKENLCKKDVFLADFWNGTFNDSNHIGLILSENKRIYKYIKREYLNDVENLESYKILISQANGDGSFGETLSKPLVEGPYCGSTETFISIGNFKTQKEAENLSKYISTKFLRTLLGILKVTQNGNKPVWKYVPMQDFTPSSDIDWSQSIHDIDLQLYQKYGLDETEIEFIESHVKEMK